MDQLGEAAVAEALPGGACRLGLVAVQVVEEALVLMPHALLGVEVGQVEDGSSGVATDGTGVVAEVGLGATR